MLYLIDCLISHFLLLVRVTYEISIPLAMGLGGCLAMAKFEGEDTGAGKTMLAFCLVCLLFVGDLFWIGKFSDPIPLFSTIIGCLCINWGKKEAARTVKRHD